MFAAISSPDLALAERAESFGRPTAGVRSTGPGKSEPPAATPTPPQPKPPGAGSTRP